MNFLERKSIKKIQRQFRSFLLNKKLNEFRELNVDNKANELNFDKFTRFIRIKEVILKTRGISEYLSTFMDKINLNGQKILISYLLKYFPDEILGKEKRHFTDEIVLDWSSRIIDILNSKEIFNYEDVKYLHVFLQNYSIVISQWLQGDKNRTIESIIISYKNRGDHIEKIKNDNSIENSQKLLMLKELNSQQKDLLESISMIDNNFDINYLKENYNYIYKNLESGYKNLLDGLGNNMQKAFFDMLVQDLKDNKIENILKNFQEIGVRLTKICPRNRRESFNSKFKEDDLINILVSFDWNPDLVKFLGFLIDSVVIFGIAADDEENQKWRKYMSTLMTDNYEQNLPLIIIQINQKIDKLYQDIIKFSDSMKNKK